MEAVSRAELSPIAYLLRSADLWSDRPAVAFEGDTRTYAELLQRVEKLAGALRAAGVGAGDRVAAILPNVPAMLELHYAVPGSGAVLVPLNPRLSAAELAYVFDHAGVSAVVAAADLRDSVLSAARELGREIPVIFDEGGCGAYERFLAAGERLPLRVEDELDPISLNYTSGTTGKPKGVMYVHRGSYLHALGMLAETRLDCESRYLWTLPMFHCNGWAFTWAVTAAGACHICLERFEPTRVWELIAAGDVSHMCGAPTIITMLAESPAATPAPAPVRVYIGGSPPTPTLLERAANLNFDLTQLYGLTETYGPIAVCARRPDWADADPAALAVLKARQGVGTVVSRMIRVVDEEMGDVPRDGETLGEVVMSGNNVMVGYYRDREATEQAFRGGWFHTGDLGVMHANGYVELRDRLKDIIISGGENISTIELERTIAAHPDVVEAAVVGVPDERWGEVPKAYLVCRGDAAPSAEEVQEFVRGRLARYKVPRQVEFVDDLPRTATGKIEKFRLRDGLIAGAAADD
jgi:fatty-acyl-CoA synthase